MFQVWATVCTEEGLASGQQRVLREEYFNIPTRSMMHGCVGNEVGTSAARPSRKERRVTTISLQQAAST